MTTAELTNLTLVEARAKLDAKEITVQDLLDAHLRVVDEKNKDLNAILEVYDDLQEQVDIAQKIIDNGDAMALTGIPVVLKDNILNEGKRAGAASKILDSYISTYDSTVVEKLKAQHAILLGRANMDEFAMGTTGESSAYGATKNPLDTTRVAGGSSAGSAASVSSGMTTVALGSDTGGSIRLPASWCGIVGLKPTYGSVSRHGLMAMASSFDVIGPLTKTVEDAEIVFDSIKGVDPLDSTTAEGDTNKEVKKIGVPYSFVDREGIDPAILSGFKDSIAKLESAGYEIVDVSLDSLEYALAVYYVLVPAEISSNMARYDGVRYGEKENGGDLTGDYEKTRGMHLGAEVKRRIITGNYVLSAGYKSGYYTKAWQVRTQLRKEVEKVFEEVDVIALPTAVSLPFKLGENIDDPLANYLADIFTVTANTVGIPAISIPSGTIEVEGKKLRDSLQLFAPHFGEKRLFELGKKFETM